MLIWFCYQVKGLDPHIFGAVILFSQLAQRASSSSNADTAAHAGAGAGADRAGLNDKSVSETAADVCEAVLRLGDTLPAPTEIMGCLAKVRDGPKLVDMKEGSAHRRWLLRRH